MSNHLEVAKIILSQIGGGLAMKCLGGYNIYAVDESNGGLKFRFKCKAKDGINGIRILLDDMDTYTVEFTKLRAGVLKVVHQSDNVYCDQLQELIESTTGLFVSPFRKG